MLIYVQRSGRLYKDGKHITTGYSGAGEGHNNPAMQNVAGEGPIPCGMYTIGRLFDSEKTGHNVMDLEPDPGTETFGRGFFECHGDSLQHPGAASHGCIILSLPIRVSIVNKEPDRKLKVVAEDEDVCRA